MDLLSLWIPGGNWRFGELTRVFWSRLVGEPIVESSVSLGLATTLAIILAWRQRASFRALDLSVWWVILASFAVLSLGPLLQVGGFTIPIVLPYRLLEILLPPLELSGCPVRMVVMVTLAAGILAGLGVDELLRRRGSARAGAVLLVALMVLELLPGRISTTAVEPLPGWVSALASLDKDLGFMDVDEVVVGPPALYFQTVHEVPIFEGYVARIPASVLQRDAALRALRRRRDFRALCEEHGFAYFLFGAGRGAASMPVAPIWSGEDLELYDVRAAWECSVPSP
jgi:hypothetical protein